MMLFPIKHLSVSALKEFIACPRKFRLRRLDGVVPSHRPVALALGSAFHESVGFVLHRHSLGEALSPSDAAEHFRQGLKKQIHKSDVPVLFEDDETEETLGEKGAKMLAAFWRDTPLPDRVLGIEQRFSLEIRDPETGELLPPLVGSIDAAVEVQDQPELWELKTGKQRWADDKLEYDFQITAYQLAYRTQHQVAPALKLAVVTKAREPAVQLVKLRRSRADELELLGTAASVCRAIKAGVDHVQRTWACKSCEFAEVCP